MESVMKLMMKINNRVLLQYFMCQKLKSKVSCIELKPVFDFILRSFSLLFLNPMCPLKYVLNCEKKSLSYFDLD
jgi:hypothetical protein